MLTSYFLYSIVPYIALALETDTWSGVIYPRENRVSVDTIHVRSYLCGESVHTIRWTVSGYNSAHCANPRISFLMEHYDVPYEGDFEIYYNNSLIADCAYYRSTSYRYDCGYYRHCLQNASIPDLYLIEDGTTFELEVHRSSDIGCSYCSPNLWADVTLICESEYWDGTLSVADSVSNDTISVRSDLCGQSIHFVRWTIFGSNYCLNPRVTFYFRHYDLGDEGVNEIFEIYYSQTFMTDCFDPTLYYVSGCDNYAYCLQSERMTDYIAPGGSLEIEVRRGEDIACDYCTPNLWAEVTLQCDAASDLILKSIAAESTCSNLADNTALIYDTTVSDCIYQCQQSEDCKMINFYSYFKETDDSRCYLFDDLCTVLGNRDNADSTAQSVVYYKTFNEEFSCAKYPSDWTDRIGDDCESYSSMNWCVDGVAWRAQNYFTALSDTQYGLSALDVCCECGGGVDINDDIAFSNDYNFNDSVLCHLNVSENERIAEQLLTRDWDIIQLYDLCSTFADDINCLHIIETDFSAATFDNYTYSIFVCEYDMSVDLQNDYQFIFDVVINDINTSSDMYINSLYFGSFDASYYDSNNDINAFQRSYSDCVSGQMQSVESDQIQTDIHRYGVHPCYSLTELALADSDSPGLDTASNVLIVLGIVGVLLLIGVFAVYIFRKRYRVNADKQALVVAHAQQPGATRTENVKEEEQKEKSKGNETVIVLQNDVVDLEEAVPRNKQNDDIALEGQEVPTCTDGEIEKVYADAEHDIAASAPPQEVDDDGDAAPDVVDVIQAGQDSVYPQLDIVHAVFAPPVDEGGANESSLDEAIAVPPAAEIMYPQLGDTELDEKEAVDDGRLKTAVDPTPGCGAEPTPGCGPSTSATACGKQWTTRSWMFENLFFATVYIEKYHAVFVENGYDNIDAIAQITRDDLKRMNIASASHQKEIMKAINFTLK